MKTAVILFNLGGPDSPKAIKPFLFNLFSDPVILGLPQPFRWMLAKYISGKRAPVAQEIYAHLGGRSPILPETEAQGRALESVLGPDFKTFIAMRYWHPFTLEAAQAARDWGAERVILLPLYPQYSVATTGSSLKEWKRTSTAMGWSVPTDIINQYPIQNGLIQAIADLIRTGYTQAEKVGKPRILFSAHGLPKKLIDQGDPYQIQVEQTTAAIVSALAIPQLDSVICYQSRVGRMEWIGPATDEELKRAGTDKVPVVVVPVAFVSEHSETLVELDIEYRHLAHSFGIPLYVRIPAVGCHSTFIQGLADLISTSRG